jgi:signal transduction histidine kinase
VPGLFSADFLRTHRHRWPLLVLLASIGLTAAAAFDAQRAIRSQRDLARLALSDYSSFAAWSYAQHLRDTLGTIVSEVLGAVNHGNGKHVSPQVPVAADMAEYLPYDTACMCHHPLYGPAPEVFFALKIGAPALDVGTSSVHGAWPMRMSMHMRMDHTMEHREWNLGPAEEASAALLPQNRWIVDSLTAHIRHLGRVDHGYSLVVGDVGGRPSIVAYTLMPTAWGDTLVYGARYSTQSFADIAAAVLDRSGQLPSTLTAGRPNREMVAVRVRDAKGHTLFDSAPKLETDVGAHIDLPDPAGQLSLDATVRPEVAGSLLIGGLPKSHLPFLLGLLGLAAALSIVAVAQIRRDGELARLRADFVSSVSHELRTPVAQIRLYADTLRLGRAATDEQRAWSLAHIERETTRLTYLVENVLRFSSLGLGSAQSGEPIDAHAEVERIVEEFRPLAASRRAEVCVEESSALSPTPPVRVRPESLRHILLNLLDNAVKYGPAGQTIHVSVGRENGAVAIAVADQGPGVPSAERTRIWRPFVRGAAAHDQGGSGIGLTIVREVARAHGGEARVEDAPDGATGARFVVTLPVDSPEDA